MGAKKKQEGGGGGKKDAGDDSGEKLYRAYRKNLTELGLSIPRKLEEKFSEIRDEKNPGILSDIVVWDEIGPLGVRAIAEALKDTQYPHLRNIRFWKANTEDDGMRSLCGYLKQCPSVLCLEFVECNITALGCEFLSKVLMPSNPNSLMSIKLDHNPIGNLGITNLSKGLCMNPVMKSLSLGFCHIDEHGARSLMEILIFQNSGLEDLDLQGNILHGEGVCIVFHGMQINKAMTKLNLSDNQFGEEKTVIEALLNMLRHNETLNVLDMRYNGFYDTGAQAICEGLKNNGQGRLNSTLTQLLLSQNKVSEEMLDELTKTISAGKGKRGKKGKKGKKKG